MWGEKKNLKKKAGNQNNWFILYHSNTESKCQLSSSWAAPLKHYPHTTVYHLGHISAAWGEGNDSTYHKTITKGEFKCQYPTNDFL